MNARRPAPDEERGISEGGTDSTLARLEGRVDEATHHLNRTDWVEILAAVILALATIMAAWSAYQSSRWGGDTGAATSESIALPHSR